jgi:predicted porin
VKILRALILLIVLIATLPAADFESWHSFDFVPVASEKFELTIHTQLRTRSRFQELSQFRFGPIARYSLHPNVRVAGGYYYRDLEDVGRDWSDSHRVFVGIENPFSRGRVNIQSRAYLEHYFGATVSPYNRFRHRFRVEWSRKVEPYAAAEYFVVAEGLQAVRYMAGIQRRLSHGARLDIAYYYDDFHLGTDRQALVTSLRFDFGRDR